MKTKLFIWGIALIAITLGITACSDDDDNVPQDKVPAAVKETFNQMFPMATPKWEMEFGMYKAEWKEEGHNIDAWFMRNGEWKCTDRSMLPTSLPQAVIDYIVTNYPGYHIDDVDYMETPTATYYEIELEKKGAPDVELKITADGKLIEGGFEPWTNTDGDVAWKNIPDAVKQTFRKMYPNINAEWELERGLYKAEWEEGPFEIEAFFKADGTWVITKTDVPVGNLPTVVTNYVSTNYPGYTIDDATFIEKPEAKYFLLELEKKGAADIYLKITEDGNVIA